MSISHIWQDRENVFAVWSCIYGYDNGFFVVLLNKQPIDGRFDPRHVVATYFDKQVNKEKCLSSAHDFIKNNFKGVNWIDGAPVEKAG